MPRRRTKKTNLKRALIITSKVPYPPISGAQIRINGVINAIAKEYVTDLLIINFEKPSPKTIKELKKITGGGKIFFFTLSKPKAVLQTVVGLLHKRPLQVSLFYSKKAKEWVKHNFNNYDVIICNHVRTTELCTDIPTDNVIVDLHDSIALNYTRAKKFVPFIWKIIYAFEIPLLKKYETNVSKRFARTIVVSPVDKQFIITQGGNGKKIIVIPVAVRRDLKKPSKNIKEKEQIVFFGKMNYFPNEDAVVWFVKEIFPKVLRKNRETQFFIVGVNPSKKVLKLNRLDNVHITGYVKDPYTEYILPSKVVVCPIRYGAGIQNKVLEAMWLGKPLVVTGMVQDPINCPDLLAANDPDEFAEKVILLQNNKKLRKEIGRNLKNFCRKNYSYKKISAQFMRVVKENERNKS